MKQFSNVRIKSLIGLFIFSIIFSACSSSSSVSNSNASRRNTETAQTQADYSNAMSANSASNSTMSTAPLAEERKSSGERYSEIAENPFLESSRAPLSTFSIDVDTASYANVRLT